MSNGSPNTVALAGQKRRWVTRALALVACTMAYNIVEASVALWSGAAAESVALLGFGLDSVIETAAAGLMLWRLGVEARGGDTDRVAHTEHRVVRFVGATFLLLAVYILAQTGFTLWTRHVAKESLVGIILAILSLILMPLLSWGKFRAAREIGSRALRAEAKETLACSYLSLTLLLGLLANAAAGWWWADPVAALLMVPWLITEGREGLLGEEC